MATINNKLILFKSKHNFDSRYAESTDGGVTFGDFLGTSIVFIEDAKQIWTHGQFYDANKITLTSLGITATAEELNYIDGVTSNVQTQLNEIKESVDSISDPYEINLTNLLSAEDSESISTAIGGIDKLNATVQDNRLILGTISNGSVSVSIRILGNVTTLYYLLDSVVGLTLNEIAITNTSGTLSKRITTHSVLTENMVINSLESDETTLPLSAAQGKVLATDKQNKTDDALNTENKTIVGAINEILPNATGVGKVASNGTGEIFNSYEGSSANKATGKYSHAEGYTTKATGDHSHAEGWYANASGFASHAEGSSTASGDQSHAEATGTASGDSSHAEGNGATAEGDHSHAEGFSTTATGEASHAEGNYTKTIGNYSHAEGNNTSAAGEYAHAEGNYTQTYSQSEHAEGTYNKSYNSDYDSVRVIHSVGIGSSTNDRKNAHEIKFNGDHYVYGLGNFDGTNSAGSQTLQEVINSKQKTITAGTGLAFDGDTLNVTLDTTVFKVVSVLPDSPAQGDENKIHLVSAESTGTNNIYTEYVYVNSAWEILGEYTSEVDLTLYLTKEEASDTYATKDELQEVQTSVSGKQDTLVSGQNIKTLDGESLLGEGDIQIKYPFPSTDSSYYSGVYVDLSLDDLSTEIDKLAKGVNIVHWVHEGSDEFYQISDAFWADHMWQITARLIGNPNVSLWGWFTKSSKGLTRDNSKYFQTTQDETLQTTSKTIPGAINELKSVVDTIPGIYELNGLTALSDTSSTSEQISTAIGGWDNLVAAIQAKKLVIDTFIKNGINATVVYTNCSIEDNNTIMLSSVASGSSFYIAIQNTNGTLSLIVADLASIMEEKFKQIENTQSVYTTVPELTADYTIPANTTTREYIYEISIGATTHNVTIAEGIKWIDNNLPLIEANSKLIVSVVNNIAVWGTVYE